MEVQVLGAGDEIGRSAILVKSKENVLLDCGVKIQPEPPKYPQLPGGIDACIISHAHLDHCLHPETLVQLSDGSIKKITEVETGDVAPALDFKYSMKMHSMPAVQRGGIKTPEKIYKIRTSTKRIKATGNHPLFVLEDGEIKIRHTEKIKPGDFIATPRSIEIEGEEQKLPKFSGVPGNLNEHFAQLLGYILGDGHKPGRSICCTDKDIRNVEFYSEIAKSLGFNPKIKLRERNRLLIHSVNFVRFLDKIEPAMLKRSSERKVPQVICMSPKSIVASFLRGLYDAEGSVKHHSVVLSTSSENIAHGIQMLLLRFGIVSHIYDHDNTKSTFGGRPAYQIAVSHPASLKTFNEKIGFSDIKKKSKLEKIADGAGKGVSEKIDIIPVRLHCIMKAAEEVGLRKIDLRKIGFHYYHYKNHYPSKEALLKLVENLERIAKEKRVESEKLDRLAKISRASVLWDPVKKVTESNAETDEVYDLTIPGHSNYIANGMFVHNCGGAPIIFTDSQTKPQIPIYMTDATSELAALLIKDSIKVARKNGYPAPFDKIDLKAMIKDTRIVNYEERFSIGEFGGVLYDAGHIPGSAGVFLSNGKRIFYTGDIQTADSQLLRGCRLPKETDLLIIESTYSNKNHPRREDEEQRLLDAVDEALANNEVALIPVFAVGRAQEVLLILEKYANKIALDGMAKAASDIIAGYGYYLKERHRLKNILKKIKFVHTDKDRQTVMKRHPIIISSAGMLGGGPAIHYLRSIQKRKESKILFTGFLVEESPGRNLIETKIFKNAEEQFHVHCDLQQFELSAHAGRSGLFEIIKKLKPKQVICVHGENCKDFAKEIEERFAIDAYAPKNGESVRF